MNEQDIDEVAGLIAACQGRRLIQGEIDRMEQESPERIAHERHEAPRRIVGPIDSSRVQSLTYRRSNESGKSRFDVHIVTAVRKDVTRNNDSR